ncbi:MAG: hypothetical protein Q8906_09215, partial [Bacillota bacterium]|nr:hypothetical protein [Bacillota bacterium]
MINSTIFIIVVLSVIVFLLLASTLIQRRKALLYKNHAAKVESFVAELQPFHGLEKNLDKILKLVATEIPAPTIALYIWNEKNEQFVLKSVRVQSDHDAKIGPSYSGLVPYSKEMFHPPINLPFDASSLKT